MSKLLYKTRGMSSPQGKPRVYFCCHPGDFARYFEEISDEILARQNCTLWYDPAEERVFDEERQMDLSQMQLFVMPVTTRLLTTPNRALEEEFPFAAAHHIPVLPLMQEGGLETLFNLKCGNLQFLDKHARDATAIPYGEKLDRYLSAVLIGDELAKQVREAFDAYVFLSYRKKDRQYAQKLMRLIHRNGFCRDIAIWYDEFLAPGENFNEAIAAALEKSGLFALVVTPNLVNEANYVMTTEYPMARQAGKPILPAELVSTDREELKRGYEDIPDCVEAEDEPALTEALLAAVRGLALRANDGDPRHNFFIGLAYLGGIDVEVDHERAVELITGAAEAGLPEAMEKLVNMYRAGEGVERDYRTALSWQKKLVEQAEREHGVSAELFCAVRALCDYGYELRDMKEAGLAAERMVEIGRALDDRRLIFIGYDKLGDLCLAERATRDAREYYGKALALSEALNRENGTAQSRRDLALGYVKMGDGCLTQVALEEAGEHYKRSLDLREALAAETGTAEDRREVAVSYERLGGIRRIRRDLAGARECVEKALAIRETLAAETGAAWVRRELFVGRRELADLLLAEGDLAGAREGFERVLTMAQALDAELETVESRRDLYTAYAGLGNVFQSAGDPAGARGHFEKALPIFEGLAADTGTVESRRELAGFCGKLGKVCREAGDLPAAQGYYERAVAIHEALVRARETLENYDDLADFYFELAAVSGDESYREKAWNIYTTVGCSDEAQEFDKPWEL